MASASLPGSAVSLHQYLARYLVSSAFCTRLSAGRKDVAIVRIEQIAPFPLKQFEAILEKYPNAKLIWVQEEPENMGAWSYILRVYRKKYLDVVARKPSASTAVGYLKVHDIEQKDLVKRAFEI